MDYSPRSDALDPPEHGALVDELSALRRAGITKLRQLELPALDRAAVATGLVEPGHAVAPAVIERLVTDSIARLGGGEIEDAAAVLYGLQPGMRGHRPSDLRERAAAIYERSKDTFRLNYEPMVIEQLAEAVLGSAHDHKLRLGRLNLEAKAPVHSRLAVSWVERFEAYYRLWTPLSGLYGDVEAYYSSQLEVEAPEWWQPEEDGDEWDPQFQAEGYGRFALFHFTRFLSAKERFVRRYGGLWLVADQESEDLIANAVHQVGWQSPFNEQDDSWLRSAGADTAAELDPFLKELAGSEVGRGIHTEWQDWLRDCRCEQLQTDGRATYVHGGCRPHQTASQARLYCQLIL